MPEYWKQINILKNKIVAEVLHPIANGLRGSVE
jgi:hypothetical protein